MYKWWSYLLILMLLAMPAVSEGQGVPGPQAPSAPGFEAPRRTAPPQARRRLPTTPKPQRQEPLQAQPYAQQQPPAPGRPQPDMQLQQQAPLPQQQYGQPQPDGQQPYPSEYAFRPDLTNPQYGECLQLERTWRSLYQQYYNLYEQCRMMDPYDASYSQVSQQAMQVKANLDQAWSVFCSRCIYFPRR